MSQTLDRPHVSRAVDIRRVAPAGPAWFGSVMGTGILATLLQVHAARLPFGHAMACGLLVVAWALLTGLTTGFARRVLADPRVLVASVSETAGRTHWGMVAMGLLSVGSATITVVPTVTPSAMHCAVVVDAVLWSLGTAVGLVTTAGFTTVLVRGGGGRPAFTWGLPVVPPMVSATTGAALVPHVDGDLGRLALVLVCAACFVLALVIGTCVFAVAYRHHLLRSSMPVVASTSAWIPLGIVGQSTAAAQAIAVRAEPLLTPSVRPELHALADGYGAVVLALGVPLVGYAVAVTARGFAARMPFTPGWWSLTFPIGTLALGAHLLATQPGFAAYEIVGLGCVLVLCGTWSLCAVASLRAVVAGRRLHSWNAVSSTPMLKVNRLLGYQPVAFESECQKTLPA